MRVGVNVAVRQQNLLRSLDVRNRAFEFVFEGYTLKGVQSQVLSDNYIHEKLTIETDTKQRDTQKFTKKTFDNHTAFLFLTALRLLASPNFNYLAVRSLNLTSFT